MLGWHLAKALINRARVAVAQRDFEQAERDVHNALTTAAEVEGYQIVPDALEILAEIACHAGGHREASRLAGAAAGDSAAHRVRFASSFYEPAYAAAVTKVRDALGDEFDAAWAEGAALSLEEAIAYAQRGHGERKRPSTGWASLTPTELDVVRLVSEGLGNKDIASQALRFPSHGADAPDACVQQAGDHFACRAGPGGGPARLITETANTQVVSRSRPASVSQLSRTMQRRCHCTTR